MPTISDYNSIDFSVPRFNVCTVFSGVLSCFDFLDRGGGVEFSSDLFFGFWWDLEWLLDLFLASFSLWPGLIFWILLEGGGI